MKDGAIVPGTVRRVLTELGRRSNWAICSAIARLEPMATYAVLPVPAKWPVLRIRSVSLCPPDPFKS